MELKTNKRELTIPTKSIDVETRTIDVAFCSETPVEREINGEIYNEVLICTPQSVDLRRLNNNGAVLFNHNRDDLIGAVVSARIDSDRVGRATLRISNTATDKWEMIQEGVLVHISIGYNINNYRIDGNTIYVTDFEIYEVSLVTVPADVMAGIGRSMDNVDISESLNNNSETKSEDQPVMEDENKVDSVEEPSLIEEIKDEVKEIEDAVETVVEEIETVVEEIETAVETVVEEIKGEPRSLTDDELFDELQARPELINKINNIDEENRKRELIAIGSVLNINVDEAIAKEGANKFLI
ncbi:HK97 family phage prohead protease [Phytobacter ursingii]